MDTYTEEVVTSEQPDPVVKTRKSTVSSTAVTPPVGNPYAGYTTKKRIFHAYQVIWYIVGFLETILLLRVGLKVLGANPYSGFSNFIYTLTDPFVSPFAGILRTNAAGPAVFEWSTLVAALIYLLAAWGIVELIRLVKPVSPQEVVKNVDVTPE